MNFANLVFILMVLLTAVGSLATVLSRSILYALMGLVATMFGIAGLYIYLNAPFLAMMQILIYVGAISILIAFAIMLAGPFSKRPREWTTVTKFVLGLIVSAGSFFMFYTVVMGAFRSPVPIKPFLITTQHIGRALFDRFAFPFELISLLIVVSIIGAVMLALISREGK
jgi:NADH:ubiquinone oxidoreductase subunit 6 (subunit J)